MSDWNDNIIEEFRANGGAVGGTFAGRPLLLLHHKGARTGIERVSPLMYQKLDDGYAVFASKGGADTNPDWLHNLKAHPETSIEVGDDRVGVRARIADGAEREAIWERWKTEWTFFAEYEEKTARDRIPVVVLEPV
ncbi:MAG: nitroreductase family deazaflavin-dependent oxidoreductase [Acidimicrobiia bacterium]|jgi:deazaflavin-dependent oxidoreductase (nitroreductase family)